MFKKSLPTILLVLFILIPINSFAKKKIIALLPIKFSGIEKELAIQYQLSFQQALQSRYKIISGSEVEEALKNYSIRSDCDSSKCLEEITYALNTDYVGRPSIYKAGEEYVISLEIKDAYKNEIIESLTGGCENCSSVAIMQKIKALVLEKNSSTNIYALREKKDIEGGVKIVRTNFNRSSKIEGTIAMLEIESKPNEAEVFINGVNKGKTPIAISNLQANNSLEVVLKKKDYRDKVFSIFLEPKINSAYADLTPAFGLLKIETDPSDATIFLGNRELGKTPYKSSKITSGKYFILIKKRLYEDLEQEIEIQDGKTTDLDITLKENFGYLIIKSDPDDAKVSIRDINGNIPDGISNFKTPFKEKITAGSYTVSVSKKGYISSDDYKVGIKQGETVEITPKECELRKKEGRVMISSSPYKKGASIFINGSYVSSIPGDVILPEGYHKVKVRIGNLEGEEEIYIKDRKETSIKIILKPVDKLIGQFFSVFSAGGINEGNSVALGFRSMGKYGFAIGFNQNSQNDLDGEIISHTNYTDKGETSYKSLTGIDVLRFFDDFLINNTILYLGAGVYFGKQGKIVQDNFTGEDSLSEVSDKQEANSVLGLMYNTSSIGTIGVEASIVRGVGISWGYHW